MSYGSSLSFVVIGQYLSEVWALRLSHISEVKFAVGGILVPFRGRHQVYSTISVYYNIVVILDICTYRFMEPSKPLTLVELGL
jgi:hypothetical protein